MNEEVDRAARQLAHCRLGNEPFGGFALSLRPRDEDHAYEVQDRLHELLPEFGCGELVGHKIGCTTDVMQEYLGIPNPCGGGVFSRNVHQSPGMFRHEMFQRVGVECEIAVLIEEDLDPAEGPFTIDGLEHCIGGLVPAIEIVEDRYVSYPDLDTPTLIADDFFAAGAVLGSDPRKWDREMATSVTARMEVDGVEVGRGRGSDILGDPSKALTWFVNRLTGRGVPLRRGQFVLLGSLVATVWIEPGQKVVVDAGDLGQISATFSP